MGWSDGDTEAPHRDLKVWRLGMRLAMQAYRLTANFPEDEKFGLVSQLRRASTSVPSNIAEGSARKSAADFLRFLYNARGSLAEIDTQMEMADQLGYLDAGETHQIRETFDNLSRGLQGLITRLEERR